jgi:ERCC4-type nuclease
MGVLIVDSREQKCEHINQFMEQHGIKTVRSKLYCGDYALLENQTVCIDRKAALGELANNLTSQHERFRAEMVRAQGVGIKLIFLIEHSVNVKSLDDVRNWVNPRLKTSPKAITGARMAAIMETMAQKYGVEFMFCAKKDTGRIICEILGEPIRE